MQYTYYKNQAFYLEIAINDYNGDFVTSLPSGDVVHYEVRESSNNSLFQEGDMSIDGDVWKAQITFTQIGEYRATFETPTGYDNGMIEILVLEESQQPEVIVEKLNKILGLTQSNYRIFNPLYDASDNLTSATIKIYTSKADCDADTNVLSTYSMTATYTRTKMLTYRVTEE